MGYILGKAEGKDDLLHGHVTAVTGILLLLFALLMSNVQ